jgi:DNA mismatch repair protein MutL
VGSTIRVLDDALCDQIAAGEVVERPASVVKELLENAVDAGATRIQVEIEDAGCARIRVVDDGTGMSEDDALLCLRRHATSKLRSIDDLQSIATLGFRGEALPSIASVSRLTLTTREREAVAGTQVGSAGGAEPRASAIGCAPGTAVEVRDLFFNVPARLKFLKSRPTESGHVAAVCTRLALVQPEIALSLTSDGRAARDFARGASFVERVQQVFPGEALTTFEDERDGVLVQCALSAPERGRNGSTGLHLFVNGRPIRDQSLARAVAYAYGSVLPPGRYPVGAVCLRLASDRDAITRLLAKHLGTSAFRGPIRRPSDYWEQRLGGGVPSGLGTGVYAPLDVAAGGALHEADPWGLASASDPATGSGFAEPGLGETFTAGGAPYGQPSAPAQTSLDGHGFFGTLRVLAQVRSMLLVCEGRDALYVIDQHAADERIRYDRLRRAYADRDVKTQRLLFPERVACTEVEAAICEGQAEALAQVGLECSLLGPGTIAVHTVPALLSRAAPERLVRDMLAELERDGGRSFSAAIDRAIATMACHGAIRAGDPLSPEQAAALLRNLDAVGDFAGHCPHGRPVVHSIPLDDLERRLGR